MMYNFSRPKSKRHSNNYVKKEHDNNNDSEEEREWTLYYFTSNQEHILRGMIYRVRYHRAHDTRK